MLTFLFTLLGSYKKNVLQSFIIDSNEALDFKLGKEFNLLLKLLLNHAIFFIYTVREPSDVDNDETTFKPEMSHQIFGEKYVQVKTLRII